MTINKAVLHNYKQARTHQMAVYAAGGGMLTTFADGSAPQQSYGSSAYGFHAVAAFASARSHIHFLKTLGADIAASDKRSKSAKRGWKTRKAMN